LIQFGKQPQVDTANEEVEDGLGIDDEAGDKMGAGAEFEGDRESEGVHWLPILSPLFNAHADLSPF
jgi:hypothetical protein